MGKILTIFILQNFSLDFYFISQVYYMIFERFITFFRRLVFPLWWLGGYTFSWQQAYALSPYFGYAALCNPLLYALEGVRGMGIRTRRLYFLVLCDCFMYSSLFMRISLQLENYFVRLDPVEI